MFVNQAVDSGGGSEKRMASLGSLAWYVCTLCSAQALFAMAFSAYQQILIEELVNAEVKMQLRDQERN